MKYLDWGPIRVYFWLEKTSWLPSREKCRCCHFNFYWGRIGLEVYKP